MTSALMCSFGMGMCAQQIQHKGLQMLIMKQAHVIPGSGTGTKHSQQDKTLMLQTCAVPHRSTSHTRLAAVQACVRARFRRQLLQLGAHNSTPPGGGNCAARQRRAWSSSGVWRSPPCLRSGSHERRTAALGLVRCMLIAVSASMLLHAFACGAKHQAEAACVATAVRPVRNPGHALSHACDIAYDVPGRTLAVPACLLMRALLRRIIPPCMRAAQACYRNTLGAEPCTRRSRWHASS